MNIALLSLPRSGTRYFSYLISQSPSVIKFNDEPFNVDNASDTVDDYIAYCESQLNEIEKYQSGLLIKDNITFHLITLIDQNDTSAINFFNRYKTVLEKHFVVIKLIRKNIFDQTLSQCVASKTNVWVNYHNTAILKCHIDLDSFKKECDLSFKKHKLLSEIKSNYVVDYDDLSSEYATDWNLVNFIPRPTEFYNFGGIPNHPKNSTVINYKELYEWYQDHKYEYKLDL